MSTVRRFGQRMNLREDCVEEYVAAHASTWPEVLASLQAAHVRRYSIFLDGRTVFACFEYTGDDFDADMAVIDDDPVNARWRQWMTSLAETDDAGRPLLWTDLTEIFRLD